MKALGVTTLYLCPIFESASNHRYNTADYTRIDPMLGTEADFRALCAQARQRGMRVILDGVFNHTGSQSMYFNADGYYPTLGAAQSPGFSLVQLVPVPPLAGFLRLLVGHPHSASGGGVLSLLCGFHH